MFWYLAQTKTRYFSLLPEILTSLALFSRPQLALQEKNCQVWTSFWGHCMWSAFTSVQNFSHCWLFNHLELVKREKGQHKDNPSSGPQWSTIREIPCPAGVPGHTTRIKNGKMSNGFNIEDAMQYLVPSLDDPDHDMLKKCYHQQYLNTHVSTFCLPLYSCIYKQF